LGRRAHSHLGYVTRETYETFYTQAFENVLSYLQGVPLRELVACSLETTLGPRRVASRCQ
jgi:phosphoglycerate dehydrogenase-like enzyme